MHIYSQESQEDHPYQGMDDLYSENLQKNPTTIELSKDESSQLHILHGHFYAQKI
jgi:hypothetical protein